MKHLANLALCIALAPVIGCGAGVAFTAAIIITALAFPAEKKS